MERLALVRAINSSPGAVATAAAAETKRREHERTTTLKAPTATSSGGGAGPADPYPEPPAEMHQAPPSAHPGGLLAAMPPQASAEAGDTSVGVRPAKAKPTRSAEPLGAAGRGSGQ